MLILFYILSGEGVYNYANGDVYKGSFYRHKRHGDGTFVRYVRVRP